MDKPYDQPFNADRLYALTCTFTGDYENAVLYFKKAGMLKDAFRLESLAQKDKINKKLSEKFKERIFSK